ncbi:hypothetical protein [uncultured Rikenella sp.]|uniref:hypothetical protein n=1 Tax=uncultured Rikenella sp. TaxID=368003 RepID=UPI0026361662|nr:hypothetical protein [uncultured Rikenella sp.]
MCKANIFISYRASSPPPIVRLSQRPAPGYRGAGFAGRLETLHGVGGEGSVWSSSSYETNSIYLRFFMTEVQPDIAYLRGHGLQLRCLSE